MFTVRLALPEFQTSEFEAYLEEFQITVALTEDDENCANFTGSKEALETYIKSEWQDNGDSEQQAEDLAAIVQVV